MNIHILRLTRIGLLLAVLAQSACANINTNPTSVDLKSLPPPLNEVRAPSPVTVQRQAQLSAITDFKIE